MDKEVRVNPHNPEAVGGVVRVSELMGEDTQPPILPTDEFEAAVRALGPIPRTSIVDLLMARDGLDAVEAQEISNDVQARVAAGEALNVALAAHGIDPRELGLQE